MKKNIQNPFLSWRFISLRIIVCLLILQSSLPFSLFAHHTGTTHSPTATTRFVDPFTGKREKPAKYMVITQDIFKGTNENSNVYTTTAFGEIPLYNGMFALNASVPYTYFQQKDREDAGRMGKTHLGGKFLPFFDLKKNWFVVLEGNIGFPSGPDTDRFTGGNYYTGQGNLTLGYLYDRWNFVTRVGGIQPLSRLQPSNLQDNDGIPFYLRPETAPAPGQRFELKRTTLLSFYVTYYWNQNISLFSGFLYRTPYQGVDFDTRTRDQIPRIFREITIGGGYSFSEKYTLSIGYRYPLNQGNEFRLYDESWTVAVSFEFDNDSPQQNLALLPKTF